MRLIRNDVAILRLGLAVVLFAWLLTGWQAVDAAIENNIADKVEEPVSRTTRVQTQFYADLDRTRVTVAAPRTLPVAPEPTTTTTTLPLGGEPIDPCVAHPDCVDDLEYAQWVRVMEAFPENEWNLAMRVARAESRFIPTAANPTCCAEGIYQFTDGTWDNVIIMGPDYMKGWSRKDKLNPWRNTLAAAWLSGRDGWNIHWQVCRKFPDDVGWVDCGNR